MIPQIKVGNAILFFLIAAIFLPLSCQSDEILWTDHVVFCVLEKQNKNCGGLEAMEEGWLYIIHNAKDKGYKCSF